ncbi:MAG: DUF1062 domain-containing protein [Anaeromyxobacter sp.]
MIGLAAAERPTIPSPSAPRPHSCAALPEGSLAECSTPEAIAFLRNAPAAAWACAFDAALLGRAGVRLERSTPFTVERVPLAACWVTVRFALAVPIQARLDRLLAQELGVPRSRVPAHVDSARELRRPVFDGQRVRVLGLDEASRRDRLG